MTERTVVIIVIASAVVASTLVHAVSNNLNNRMRLKLMMTLNSETAHTVVED